MYTYIHCSIHNNQEIKTAQMLTEEEMEKMLYIDALEDFSAFTERRSVHIVLHGLALMK